MTHVLYIQIQMIESICATEYSHSGMFKHVEQTDTVVVNVLLPRTTETVDNLAVEYYYTPVLLYALQYLNNHEIAMRQLVSSPASAVFPSRLRCVLGQNRFRRMVSKTRSRKKVGCAWDCGGSGEASAASSGSGCHVGVVQNAGRRPNSWEAEGRYMYTP